MSTLEDVQILKILAFLALDAPNLQFLPTLMLTLVSVAKVVVDSSNLCKIKWSISTGDHLVQSCYQTIFVPLGARANFPFDTADVTKLCFADASIPTPSQIRKLA